MPLELEAIRNLNGAFLQVMLIAPLLANGLEPVEVAVAAGDDVSVVLMFATENIDSLSTPLAVAIGVPVATMLVCSAVKLLIASPVSVKKSSKSV
jgi:hypothetical protein